VNGLRSDGTLRHELGRLGHGITGSEPWRKLIWPIPL
jgi:hypothetical protein